MSSHVCSTEKFMINGVIVVVVVYDKLFNIFPLENYITKLYHQFKKKKSSSSVYVCVSPLKY